MRLTDFVERVLIRPAPFYSALCSGGVHQGICGRYRKKMLAGILWSLTEFRPLIRGADMNPTLATPPVAPNADSVTACIQQLPPVLSPAMLAGLLDRSLTTVLADISRSPGKLPPCIKIPGVGGTVFLTSSVFTWLAAFERKVPAQPQQTAPAVSPVKEPETEISKPRRGRPSNAELAARAAKKTGVA